MDLRRTVCGVVFVALMVTGECISWRHELTTTRVKTQPVLKSGRSTDPEIWPEALDFSNLHFVTGYLLAKECFRKRLRLSGSTCTWCFKEMRFWPRVKKNHSHLPVFITGLQEKQLLGVNSNDVSLVCWTRVPYTCFQILIFGPGLQWSQYQNPL